MGGIERKRETFIEGNGRDLWRGMEGFKEEMGGIERKTEGFMEGNGRIERGNRRD